MRRGLVLGGGGVVGFAWERGLLVGMAEEGIDVREADIIVGTSAGSLVGALVASGRPIAEMADVTLIDVPLHEDGIDLAAAAAVFAAWTQMDRPTAAGCAEVGAAALRAKTASVQAWIAATGGGLDVSDWPSKDLRISVVDVASGERSLFDHSSGVPLDRVFVIAPLVRDVVAFGAQMEAALEDEVKKLAAAGTPTTCVLPEQKDKTLFGPNMMDEEVAPAVFEFARERGRHLATSGEFVWD